MVTKNRLTSELSRDDVFGIDWGATLHCADDSHCDDFVLEDCFDLPNDPDMAAAGIKICARVANRDAGTPNEAEISNRIVFRRGGRRATVDCVHTAIATLPAGEAFERYGKSRPLPEGATEIEKTEIKLPAEEHFKSLRSYVAGIAEAGIGTMFMAEYASGSGDLPFGFNDAMRSQISQALTTLAPGITRGFVRMAISDLQKTPASWRNQSGIYKLLNRKLPFSDFCRNEPGGAETCLGLFPRSRRAAIDASKNKSASVATLMKLALRDDDKILLSLSEREKLPDEIVQLMSQMSKAKHGYLAHRIARRSHLPTSIIEDMLARSGSASLKEILAARKDLPPDIVKRIGLTGNAPMRVVIASRDDLPVALMLKMTHDANADVRLAIVKKHGDKMSAITLSRLAADPSAPVRAAVAKTGVIGIASAPAERARNRLMGDVPMVRAAVASNAITPVALLRELLHDSSNVVRYNAQNVAAMKFVRHPSEPLVREMVADIFNDENIDAIDLDAAAVIASSPGITEQMASRLSKMRSPRVLSSLCKNLVVARFARSDATPEAIREELREMYGDCGDENIEDLDFSDDEDEALDDGEEEQEESWLDG